MISDIIKTLQSDDFYGAGDYVEIAKGKNELVTDWRGFKRKTKRVWLSRKT
jgi:hypothetical protein